MADYAADISPYNYLYSGPVYYTEPSGQYRETVVLKLVLNSDNFNFNLARADGFDFRLAEHAGGGKVLNMWIAKWDKTNEEAILFFKGVHIGGGTSIVFTAFWGSPDDTGISDGDTLDTLFYEDFNSNLSSSKWTGDINNGVGQHGYNVDLADSFTTITNPFEGIRSWVVEASIYTAYSHTGNWDVDDWSIGFTFQGTENPFYSAFMHNNKQENQVWNGSSTQYVDTHMGLEGYSYQDIFLVYEEPTDKFTSKLYNRNSFNDVVLATRRNVEGDTRILNLTIHGAQSSYNIDGAHPVYIQWLIIREFDTYELSNLDGSELYREYEAVVPPAFDSREFGDDITSSDYYHVSDFGGVAKNLSINLHDSECVVWISDESAASSEANLIIGFYGRLDFTSTRYYHYDSGHVPYYNASKLSDNDNDVWNRSWFESTSTSGWVSIRYEGRHRAISYLSVKTMDSGRPKDFEFYADSVRPTVKYSLGQKLLEGTFDDVESWQNFFVNNTTEYLYYTLDIKNTYDDQPIKMKEWQMRSAVPGHGKRYVSQLRLHPYMDEDYIIAFPKAIQLEGSTDLTNWEVVLPWTSTYTPNVIYKTEYGYWQRYSFTNVKGFYNYRLRCQGNWGRTDGRMCIGEWSLHEVASEEYTYRILPGETNSINQIWCNPSTTFDNEGEIYLAIDDLYVVSRDKLSRTEDLPEDYSDLNVV
jgi:hypothetical protein